MTLAFNVFKQGSTSSIKGLQSHPVTATKLPPPFNPSIAPRGPTQAITVLSCLTCSVQYNLTWAADVSKSSPGREQCSRQGRHPSGSAPPLTGRFALHREAPRRQPPPLFSSFVFFFFFFFFFYFAPETSKATPYPMAALVVTWSATTSHHYDASLPAAQQCPTSSSPAAPSTFHACLTGGSVPLTVASGSAINVQLFSPSRPNTFAQLRTEISEPPSCSSKPTLCVCTDGLSSNVQELCDRLVTKSIDVYLIQETKVAENNVTPPFPGYNSVRVNRLTIHRGGLLILVK